MVLSLLSAFSSFGEADCTRAKTRELRHHKRAAVLLLTLTLTQLEIRLITWQPLEEASTCRQLQLEVRR